MSEALVNTDGMNKIQLAEQAKNKLDADFKRRGIITATASGMFYGTYTAFMTLAMSVGIWSYWYGDQSGLNSFAVAFLLSALGAALTDSCSAVWAVTFAIIKGKFGDYLRCLKTRPGLIMIGGALIGGPLASTFYVVGLQKAGSIVVPISALCPAIGSIIGRFVFKQELNKRMVFGIFICFVASLMIGSIGLIGGLDAEASSSLYVGLFFGFLAALGWGIEGSVCGYSSSMIDPEIGITIRQVTSGLANLFILVPVFAMIAGMPLFTATAEQPTTLWSMVSAAFTNGESMKWFVVAGLGAYFGFMLWYKGNSMCGAALGMSCNGAFSFWGPFFCWVVLGLVFKQAGWNLHPIAWMAAVVMIIGIFTIAMNPLDLFRKNKSAYID